MDQNVSWLCLRVQEVGAVGTPSINQNFSVEVHQTHGHSSSSVL